MTLEEKHIRNIFIYILPRFVGYGLNLISLPILTRILTPKDFGVVTLSLALPTIAVGVVTGGLTMAVPRYFFEYRKDSNKLNSLYFSAQAYLLIMFVVSTLIVYFTQDYMSSLVTGKTDYGVAIFIAYMATYLGQMNLIYLRIYQNMEKAALHSSFILLQVFTSVITSLILVWYFRMSYMGMIYGSFCGAVIASAALSIHFNRSVKINFSKKVLLENLKYGFQIVPKSFTGFINRFFDKYMLNAMLSMSAVGVYNIGQTVANAFDILMSNVIMSFQPVTYREIFDKGEEASLTIARMFTVFCYITLLPIILAILFAQEIIFILTPPSYYGAVDIIIILAAGISTQVFGKYVGIQYAYTKKPFWIFPVTVLGTISNVVLNILLIPVLGLIGAGLATMASLTITNLVLTFIGQKLYKIPYEWKIIVSLYALIVVATLTILYFRAMNFSNINLYPLKLIFLIAFLFIGIKAKIVTRESITKVSGALFKFSKA